MDALLLLQDMSLNFYLVRVKFKLTKGKRLDCFKCIFLSEPDHKLGEFGVEV